MTERTQLHAPVSKTSEIKGTKSVRNFFNVDLKSVLHCAIINNSDLGAIKELLNVGADVNMTNEDGETALYCAVRNSSDLSVINALLAAGGDVNCRDNAGNTLLHYVRDADVARELLSYGLSVNAVNTDKETPLFIAIRRKKGIELIESLLAGGGDVNVINTNGVTPLYSAFRYRSDLEVIKALLAVPDADVQCKDSVGDTLLHYVKSADVARELISRGLNVNTKNMVGKTPLYYATFLIPGVLEHELYNCKTAFPQNSSNNEHYVCDKCMYKELVWTLVLQGADISCGVNSSVYRMVMLRDKEWAKFFIKVALIKSSFDVLEGSIDRSSYISYFNDLKTLGIRSNFGWIETFSDNCDSEIDHMKCDMINAKTSLYTFFFKCEKRVKMFPLYPCYNKEEKDIVTNYPIYRELLLPKIRPSIERSALLNKLKHLRIYVMKSESIEICLEFYIFRVIADYLSNDDLANLIKCVTDHISLD